MFFLNLFHMIVLLLLMMNGMAFLTLFERKFLGYIQDRKGRNKVGFIGVLQPFSDVIKLLYKEVFFIDKINLYLYYFSVLLILVLSMSVWLIYPFLCNIYSMKVGILYLLSILSSGVYPIMIGGWASNSNYSMLGSIRSISQSVSYEVSLFLTMFSVILLIESYSVMDLYKFQNYIKFIVILIPIYLMFLISLLIELNRTPFDLVEGKSELVSGFNTEYFGGGFALIFMAEYMYMYLFNFNLAVQKCDLVYKISLTLPLPLTPLRTHPFTSLLHSTPSRHYTGCPKNVGVPWKGWLSGWLETTFSLAKMLSEASLMSY